MTVSTHERLFGSDSVTFSATTSPRSSPKRCTSNGTSECHDAEIRSNNDDWNSKGWYNSLCSKENTNTDYFLGSRKQRIQAPGYSGNRILSPSPVACMEEVGGSHSSFGPLRRLYPPAKDSVPLPPWAPVESLSPGMRSMSPLRARSASPPRQANDRRLTEWRHGYDLDSYRSIRVFPGHSQYQNCPALTPMATNLPDDFEHGGIRGPTGIPKAATRRRIAANARGMQSDQVSSVFGAPEVADLQAKTNSRLSFSPPPRMSMKQGVPGGRNAKDEPHEDASPASNVSYSTQTEKQPAGFTLSPRCPESQKDLSFGALPQGIEADDFRWELQWGGRKQFTAAPAQGLDRGLCSEDTLLCRESFLGPRKGKQGSSSPSHSPAPTRNVSPRALPLSAKGSDVTPTLSTTTGNLSWTNVAGDVSLEVLAQKAAVTEHRAGIRNDHLEVSKPTDEAEFQLRRRQATRERNRAAPLSRWK